MIEKESQKIQIAVAEVFPQEEVISQSAVEIFDHRTGAIGRSHDVLDIYLDRVKGLSQQSPQVSLLLPACRMGAGQVLKEKELAHDLWCDLVLPSQA